MLEKLVLFIVTVLVTLASNLAPASFMLSTPAADLGDGDGGGSNPLITSSPAMQEFPFATVDATGAATFSRMSVLWVELNEKRLSEDEWGSGHITELRFQVGVKTAEGRGLKLGDTYIPVRPTDTFTIRGFTGRYQVANIQSSTATLSLQGTVAVTSVNEGTLKGLKTLSDAKPGVRENLAYVVIEGQRNDAITFTHADSQRAYTRTDAASQTPGHLGARAVRINGEDVLDNAWGEGTLASISFDVVVPQGATETVNFNGKDLTLRTGTRVDIRDFVGSYVVYQVAGGLQKVKLDGVAKSVSTNGSALSSGPLGMLNTPPTVRASYLPLSPTTSTSIRFVDESRDPDVGGFVLFRSWDFGDGTGPSSEARPLHRYAQKGTYNVTLTVTDNALGKNSTTFEVAVANSPPHTDFNWYPKTPTTFYDIPFQDLTKDIDGTVASYHWDFGDGVTSLLRNPTHRFLLPGVYNVSLTTTDNEGAYNSVSKVVIVQNSPPQATFRWTPAPPTATYPVTFIDDSVDLDGFLIQRVWNFPSSPPKTGVSVNFTFPRSGTYPVSLTVTDNDGATTTLRRNVQVLNSPPRANFSVPSGLLSAGSPVVFVDRSVDRDGRLVNWTWDFGDGNLSFAPSPTHVFGRHGNYTVTLTVTDDEGARSNIQRSVSVDFAAPRAEFDVNPSFGLTNQRYFFFDRSEHVDGIITSWLWEFGDNTTSTQRNPDHIFRINCVCMVKLTVTDTGGRSSFVRHPVVVNNRAPTVDSVTISPSSPVAGTVVTFNATYSDVDGTVDPARVVWEFGDGLVASGRNATHIFAMSGSYTLRFSVVDDDGARGVYETRITVRKAPPIANFSFSPGVPTAGFAVSFLDTTRYFEDPGVAWEWNWGDGTEFGTTANPTHVYARGGTYTVTLRIRDGASPVGNEAEVSRNVRVNAAPIAAFTWVPSFPEAGLPARFHDMSVDDTGIRSFLWSFGEYGTNSSRNPEVTFPEPGNVDVTLRVEDLDGVVRTRTARVTVVNSPPQAAFSYSPTRVLQNQDVLFTDLSRDKTGPISRWEWDFDDGAITNVQHPVHRFAQPGYFDVMLTVIDMEGVLNSTVSTVRVAADHPYTISIDARLPDDTRLNLYTATSVDITVKNLATKARLSLARNITREVDGTATAVFGAGEWAPGDQFEVTVTAGSYRASGKATSDYSDERSALHEIPVQLSAPLTLTLEVVRSATQSPLASMDPSPPGPTTFTMPNETVRIRARVTWHNGLPVDHARVVLYTTWTITRERQPTFEGIVYNALTSTSDAGYTDENGYVILSVPPPPDDAGLRLVYPPGWYYVTGDATLSSTAGTGLGHAPPIVSFNQDPLGILGFG